MDLSIVHEEDMPLDVVEASCSCSCKCGFKDESAMESRITKELNSRLTTFFSATGNFEKQLERLVEVRLQEMFSNGSSAHNTSLLDTTIPRCESEQQRFNDAEAEWKKGIEERLSLIESNTTLFDSEDRKMKIEELEKKMRELSDFNLARSVSDEDVLSFAHSFQGQLQEMKNDQQSMHDMIDAQEAQGRKDIVVIDNVPFEGTRYKKENTTRIALVFFRYHFGIFLNEEDISVSHRTVIPDEKKKAGKNYIPPIYVKFVRRSVAQDILKRKRSLVAKNRFGQPYFISENLSVFRRKLMDRIKNELHSYALGWVSNGSIFVKKDKSSLSKPIKVNTDQKLQELIEADLCKSSDLPRPCVSAPHGIEPGNTDQPHFVSVHPHSNNVQQSVIERTTPTSPTRAHSLQPRTLSYPLPLFHSRQLNRNTLLTPTSYNRCNHQHLINDGGAQTK